MDVQLAEALVKVMDELGESVEIRRDYSGRNMYGQTTFGIVIDHPLHLIMALITHADMMVNKDGEPIFMDIESIRTDNMGRGFILY